jgi:hypothetical protein
VRRPLSLAVLALALSGIAGCRGDDDAGTGTTVPTVTASAGPATDPTYAGATAPPVSAIAETGVPGLDSADAFCSAWSRFAGSFQVVAVASSFVTDQPERAFELETAASPIVTDSYEQMRQAWPAELDAERAAAIDARFGPFAARATTALNVLRAAVAEPKQLDEIGDAWLDALATRDPSSPDVELALPDELAEAVATAGRALAADVPPIAGDPALVTEAATPLTDEYLATHCPDQGTLLGTEGD